MEKSGFVWYELMTQDLEKAVSFYSNVVGWTVHDSGMPGMPYMLFGRDGKDAGGMMSWSSLGINKPSGWKGHIFTRDVDTEVKAVVVDGGRQYRPVQVIPGVGRFAVVADPQGAEYLLFEPNQQQAPPQIGSMDLGGVGWRELMTTNWEQAWAFYSKHYGWEKLDAIEMGQAGTYQTFMSSQGYSGGMMTIPANLRHLFPEPTWLFYFNVDAIDSAAERVRQNGGEVTHGPAQVPGGTWILQGVDSQGGMFALCSQVK